MKPARFTLIPALGFALAAGLISAPPAGAQLQEDPQTLNSNALTAMKGNNWEEALKLLSRATELYDRNALQLFGPQFGVTWYRKGICELKLKRWDDAAESFEKCYSKYPNKGDKVDGAGNIFNKRALLRWGEAAQGAENYEQAIKMFKKFLEERDKTRDTFDPGSFYISLAICHLKINKIPEGVEHLETAIKNKVRFRTPDAGIVAGFQALVGAVTEKRDEKALLTFIDKNRADIVIDPFEMEIYSRLFLKLAADAMGADMEAGAIALYQLVPGTEVMIEDLKSRIQRLGSRDGMKELTRTLIKAKLQASLENLEKQRREGNPNETIQLGATAFIHEKHGNVRGAYAAYTQLELLYPKAKKREDNLYNLVRTSSIIGEVFDTETYGSRFLKTYPDSQYVPAVQRMMLTSLFYEGEYLTCIKVASEMLPKLSEKTKEHDICLHVLGGSYYYTGQYDKAQPLLDQHVEMYPESQFEQAALYFQASNLSRLQFWKKSAKLLDAFLAKYPDPSKNIYLPFALYDRANCHYAESENEAALTNLDRLESEFPNAEMIGMAYNLKGNVLQSSGDRDAAETYYKKALELAERRDNDMIAGESLFYLIAMLGEKPTKKDQPSRMKDAVPYSDKFWKEYGETSPYKTQVAVSQVHALGSVGRDEEALNRLRDVIAEMATIPGSPGLEEAINSYTDVYLTKHSADELKEHYYAFPKIRNNNKAALALLRIAIIGVYEKELKKAGDNRDAKIAAQASIDVLFKELKNDFDPKDLSPYILVSTGDFLREKTSAPRQALPYYDEALKRKDKSYLFPSLFGRASVLAEGSKEEQAKAIEDLRRVFNDSQEKPQRELALYGIVKTQMAQGEYEAAAETAKEYLSKDNGLNFSKFAPEVGLALAESYEKRDMTNDALANYVRVWSAYKGLIKISAPAMLSWMKLSWQRNNPGDEKTKGDRQGAYEQGWTYIDQTSRFTEKMTDDERKMWNQIQSLVEEYEASADITTMDKLKEEAAKK
ncbi:tetratricopeptide repeat protein [Luteolibacter marinus]|uniref:tetratricopeptide repeat protein n=1 Tax=Luteolibacter marinus TaxID=2776705 RepID=UPI00186788D3|nr:tetratricopeptide repeat protein [Luteolibacter marinus]